MTIRVRCPDCNTEYALADSAAGKKVRCKKCETVIAVKAAPEADAPPPKRPTAKAAPKAETPPPKRSASAVRAEPPRREKEPRLPVKQSERPRRARDEDDEDDDAPSIKNKSGGKKKSGGLALPLILGGAGVALLMVLVCGGVGAYWIFGQTFSSSPNHVASTPTVTPMPAPVAADGQPAALPAAQPPAGNNPPPVAAVDPPPAADNSAFHLAEVRKSVVFIRRATPGKPTSTGSGFIVTKEGLIATNRHVVQSAAGPDPATVLYVGVPSAADPDVLDYFKGQVAYVAPTQDTLDFALIKIAAKPGYQAFRPLPLATTKLDLGAPAAAIGFPFAQVDNPVLSFNKGSISATRVAIEDRPYYQTDAAVNPGNSGGPLVNAAGQVVGIVSRKMDDANNMGFALYLSETGLPSVLNQEQITRLQPEVGPLDAKQLPASSVLAPTHLASWDITHGEAVEEKGVVIAGNAGNSYWLTYKAPLPENFQLKIECYVVPVMPRRDRQRGFGPRPPVLPQQQVNLNMLRSLYVRFGTEATGDDVTTMSGTSVHLSAAQLQVAESGVVVATEPKAVPRDPFVLTVTRRGDELTLAVNDEVWTTQKLKSALQGPHKFSLGGFQSDLILHAATVTPVDGPPVPPPVAVTPPKVEPPKVDPKLWAVKAPADWKGPTWTTELDKMKAPDAPAAGWVMGGDFKVEAATLSPLNGSLTLRQGQPFAPGAYLTLPLGPMKSLADLEGKTITVNGKQPIPGMIVAQLGRTPEGEKLPKIQMFMEYTMKLEFGKGAALKLPGKIYICLPDEAKSVIAGKFLLESK